MRILIASERFAPSVGGVETVTGLLARALARLGHEVTVVTNERGYAPDNRDRAVVRRPGTSRLLREYRRTDAVVVQGPSVRLGWPLACFPRRAVMVHHMPLGKTCNAASGGFRGIMAQRVKHAAVSHNLARALPYPNSAVLPNPFDEDIFRTNLKARPTRDVLFVGRLIPEKGALVLLEALARLAPGRPSRSATIVGDGPDRARVEGFLGREPALGNVRLSGQVIGLALARLLHQDHRILVVPSTGPEAFGLVALEGLACGCAVVASDLEGLGEAVGPCGATFPAGDSSALARTLDELLNADDPATRFASETEPHLATHRPEVVARRYMELLLAG